MKAESTTVCSRCGKTYTTFHTCSAPTPPQGCICASFWTVRGTHKKDCPSASVPSAEELFKKLLDVLEGPPGFLKALEDLVSQMLLKARIQEGDYIFEQSPKFYTLPEKMEWFNKRKSELQAALDKIEKETV